MSGVQIFTIAPTDAGQRLDRWFKKAFPHIPHGRIEKLLRTGQIRVNGRRTKGNWRLEAGQSIRIPPLPEPGTQKPTVFISDADRLFLRNLVIYEDPDLIALDKPDGLAVQGGTKTNRHIDGLLPALGESLRLVHRLDRDTSGVLIIAKSRSSAQTLAKNFQNKRIKKIYWGITNGVPRPMEGEIEGHVHTAQGEAGRKMMVSVHHGTKGSKYAKTLYRTVSRAGKRAAWVEMQPQTGRKHQLRLQMQLLGTPIAGDPKYTTDRELPIGLENRLYLHARQLTIPRQKKPNLTITAPIPTHFKAAFALLGFDENAI